MASIVKGLFYGALVTLTLVITAISLSLNAGLFVVNTAAEVAAAATAAAVTAKQLSQVRADKEKLTDARSRAKVKLQKNRMEALSKIGKKIAVRIPVASVPFIGAGAVIKFAIDDYCESLGDIHETEQLLDGTNEPFTSATCVSETKKRLKAELPKPLADLL